MAETTHNTLSNATPPVGPPWLSGVHGHHWIDRRWLIVAAALSAAAVVLFGWRALQNVAIAGACAGAAYALVAWGMRQVRPERQMAPPWHTLALGLLLGLCLPPLAPAWLAAVSGAMLGVVAHGVGRACSLRVHPVAVVMSVVLIAGLLTPTGSTIWNIHRGLLAETEPILRPSQLVLGDLHDAPIEPDWPPTLPPWWDITASPAGHDALHRPAPSRRFAAQQARYLTEPEVFREAVRSRQLPSLAAVMLGVVPGPVGGTSVVLLVGVGLWLMYERLARPGTVLAAGIGAAAAVCVMPVTVGETWTWTLGELAAMSVPMAVLFATHAMLGSLLPMIVLVLAPDGQPMSTAGRLVYGLLIGAGSIAAVWSLGRPEAAYLALLVAGLLARPLDRLRKEQFKAAQFRSRRAATTR